MKKILLMMMCAIFAFTSCEKQNAEGKESPIEDIEMPDATTPIKSGDDVTIKGKGFTAASEIWLNTATKADTDLIKAEVVDFTETSITFKAPATVNGQCAVTLKQGGKEYKLGKLTFEASSIAPEEESFGLFCIGGNGLNQTVIYKIDRSSGGAHKFKTLDQDSYIENAVIIGRKAYGFNTNTVNRVKRGDSSIVSFDFTTQVYTKIKPIPDEYGVLGHLGVIDNKLHVLTNKGSSKVLYSFDPETAIFEQVCVSEYNPSGGNDPYHADHSPFIYDAVNKNIILQGGSYALNIENGTRTRLPFSDIGYDARTFLKGDQVYAGIDHSGTNATDLYSTTAKYERGPIITSIPHEVISYQYDADKNVVYMIYDPYEEGVENGLCMFDFNNSDLKQMAEECKFYQLMLVK